MPWAPSITGPVVEGLDRPLVGRLVAGERAVDPEEHARDAASTTESNSVSVLAVGAARRSAVVGAPVEAEVSVEVPDEVRGDAPCRPCS